MVYCEENHRFNKLCLNYRSFNRNNRFARKNRRTLGHRPHIALKAEIFKIIKKAFRKNTLTPQKRNIVIVKSELFEVFYKLLKSRHNGKSATVRNFSEKHIKNSNLVSAAVLEISVCHCKFIKVGKHRVIYHKIHSNSDFLPLSIRS